jgi:tetraacyldisaccharide 4'-kinase
MDKLQMLFLLGRPFGPLYGLVMRLRAACYAKDLLHRHRLTVPVISVGNLVLGGSGKTPMVRYVAEWLQEIGHRPAIISRGYGGTAKGDVNIVSDGRSVLLSPQQGGDEPCMLAHALPGVPVLVGRRRIHPCLCAVNDFHADVLILDDGFQHLAVHRHLNLALFDGTILAGDGRIFPAGILREPLTALHRADAVVFTGITHKNQQQAADFGDTLGTIAPDVPYFLISQATPKLHITGSLATPSSPCFAFCGIANPYRFRDTVISLGITPNGFLALPDHVRYDKEMLADICHRASSCGATQLLTTSKDAVKLQQLSPPLPVAVIEIALQPNQPFNLFLRKHLNEALGATSTKP